MIAAAAMGDPNASIPTPQPVHYRPMFGAYGGGLKTAVTFVSQAAIKKPRSSSIGFAKTAGGHQWHTACEKERHDP